MTWSYSRIKCFEDCPYQWFLKYIKEYSNCPTQFYASFGSLMHSVLGDFLSGKISNKKAKMIFLTTYHSKVIGERPELSIVKSYINNASDFLETFTGFQDYSTVAVEDEIRFKVNDYNFIGYIDYLGENSSGFSIVDHKSRKLKHRSGRKNPTINDKTLDSMYKQLYIYSEGVKQKYGQYPKELCFNCYRNGMFIKEPFDAQKCEDAKKWAIDTIERIKNTDYFAPSVDYFKCKYICDVNEECCYWQER